MTNSAGVFARATTRVDGLAAAYRMHCGNATLAVAAVGVALICGGINRQTLLRLRRHHTRSRSTAGAALYAPAAPADTVACLPFAWRGGVKIA